MKRVLGHGAKCDGPCELCEPCCPAEPTVDVFEDIDDELTELDFEIEEDEE